MNNGSFSSNDLKRIKISSITNSISNTSGSLKKKSTMNSSSNYLTDTQENTECIEDTSCENSEMEFQDDDEVCISSLYDYMFSALPCYGCGR